MLQFSSNFSYLAFSKYFPHFPIHSFLLQRPKMAIILPTGQWYAPSAVINDAWYNRVLHGIAWYCMVLYGIALYCIVLHGIAWYCMVVHGFA